MDQYFKHKSSKCCARTSVFKAQFLLWPLEVEAFSRIAVVFRNMPMSLSTFRTKCDWEQVELFARVEALDSLQMLDLVQQVRSIKQMTRYCSSAAKATRGPRGHQTFTMPRFNELQVFFSLWLLKGKWHVLKFGSQICEIPIIRSDKYLLKVILWCKCVFLSTGAHWQKQVTLKCKSNSRSGAGSHKVSL